MESAYILKLRVESTQEQTLRLFVDSVDARLKEVLCLEPERDYTGAPVEELFPCDLQVVDEWTAFLLRRIFDGMAGCDHSTATTLQFLRCIKRWVVATLSLDADRSLRVTLSPPSNDPVPCDASCLMELVQSAALGSFVYGCGGWTVDLPSNQIFLTRQMAEMLHLGQHSLIISLERFFAMVHPDDRSMVQNSMENIAEHNAAILSRGRLEDGAKTCFRSYGIPGYNKQGALTRIVGCSQDVTERERANEQLSLSEQRFRGIVESSRDLFVVLSGDATISYVSPNVADIAGYTPKDVLGRPFRDFIADQSELDRLFREFDIVFRGDAFTKGDYQILCADRSIIWLHISVTGIRDEGDNVVEAVAVCRDVTEERQRDEKLRYISTHDSLTGLYNRLYFDWELDRIEKDGLTDLGFLMADLNGLKLINDAFGHHKGDAILAEAAKLLVSAAGEGAVVARVGGDEFAIFLYDCTDEDLEELCGVIQSECAKTSGQRFPLSISVGAAHRSDPSVRMRTIYRQAEGRMYGNKLLDSRSMRNHLLTSLKETLAARNVETAEHTARMEQMVLALGRKLNLPTSELDRLNLLASMHDIGKVAIPDSIINKPGKLTEEEWAVMRTHCEVGCRIAMASQELSLVATEICCHHERWDGTGYPYGYTGDSIPLLSRIISVVDTYDAITNKRVYKEAMSHESAIEEIRRCAGAQFDPHIVTCLLELFHERAPAQYIPY